MNITRYMIVSTKVIDFNVNRGKKMRNIEGSLSLRNS